MDLTPEQARVVGCLIEKAATTPDSYPLSSNALTNACNQSTNRDPIVEYRERDVDAVMLELRDRKLARTVTGSGHRVGKHKHVVDETLTLDGCELAVLACLLLRGPQTLNEITARTERYADGPGGDRAIVDQAVDRLAARAEPLAVRLPRRPGEREPRIDQRCTTPHDGRPGPSSPPCTPTTSEPTTSEPTASEPTPGATDTPPVAAPPDVHLQSQAESQGGSPLEARVAALEAELGIQTRRIDDLLHQLGS